MILTNKTFYIRDLYPPELLKETEETLALLFPTRAHKRSGRTRRLREKHDVDIEAALDVQVYRNLNHYKIWGKRLAEIQNVYDASKPRKMKHWWFDRRNRFEWATFWTAIVIFSMTLIFGVISSVTGIMQVLIGFRSLQ